MLKDRLSARLALALILLLVALVTSACYKNAGENVLPTSNRAELSDIVTATPTATADILPTRVTASPAATRTTAPTSAPEEVEVSPMAAITDEAAGDEAVTGTGLPGFLAATFTPESEAADTGLATPGMSDIQPSPTPAPTRDPALLPTPTGMLIEEPDECVYVVNSGDTLYSIAQSNNVLLADLVAANPSLLGGNSNTTLQIGWELQLPGCVPEGQAPSPTPEGIPAGTPATPGEIIAPTQPPVPATGTTHVVQANETVFSIARQYNVSVDAIVAANNLIVQGNVVYITVGQELFIPPAQ
jgi:LysM repeat protein